MTVRNPWQHIKDAAKEMVPPSMIMREQASLLTQATDGLIEGSVEVTGSNVVSLSAIVPSLNGYAVELAYVSFEPSLYPCTLDASWRTKLPAIKCDDKDSLREELVGILESVETQKTVAALLAQALGTASVG